MRRSQQRGWRGARSVAVIVALAGALFAGCKELPKIQPPSLGVANPAPALTALLDRRAGAPR
jgi:hypothetical protein